MKIQLSVDQNEIRTLIFNFFLQGWLMSEMMKVDGDERVKDEVEEEKVTEQDIYLSGSPGELAGESERGRRIFCFQKNSP